MTIIIRTKEEMLARLPRPGEVFFDDEGKRYVVDSAWLINYLANHMYNSADYTVKLIGSVFNHPDGYLLIDGDIFEKGFRKEVPNLNFRCVTRPILFDIPQTDLKAFANKINGYGREPAKEKITQSELIAKLPLPDTLWRNSHTGKSFVVIESWTLDNFFDRSLRPSDGYTVRLMQTQSGERVVIDGDLFERNYVKQAAFLGSDFKRDESPKAKEPDEAKQMAADFLALMHGLEGILQRANSRTIGTVPYNELRELHGSGKAIVNNYYKTKAPK